MLSVNEKEERFKKAFEIVSAHAFINSDKFKLHDFIGNSVILLNFWTFSCINCIRTLPFINAWSEKYKEKGLEVIGIHTPEFEFEKDIDNIVSFVREHKIKYPVIVDNDYGTWNKYGAKTWPQKFIIDIDGFISYEHSGEGSYEDIEKKIQEILEERKRKLSSEQEIPDDFVQIRNIEVVDYTKRRSPEIYFGSSRNIHLANGKKGVIGRQTFKFPERIEMNKLYMEGNWDIQKEYATNIQENAKIQFKYQSEKVFLVAGSEHAQNVQILVDGKGISGINAMDVNENSTVSIHGHKMYKLIDDPTIIKERVLQITPQEKGLKLYTLTFG